jgi:exopolysaccharide biosynthesis WecB/TagA/CpsF family protein
LGELLNKFDTLTRLHAPGTSIVPRNLSECIAAVDLFGSPFICCSCENAAKLIVNEITHPRQLPILVTHINAHNFRILSSNRELLEALRVRSWCLLEGIGLKMACVLTKGWAPPDTNGTDLFPALLNELRNMPCRLFLLGGHSIVVSVAAQRIKERWKHVEIVGYKDGYFSNDQIPLIRDAVERARPTLLLIGLGSPRQEEVALDFLQVPDLQMVWTVGGLFDFLCGRIKRAPPIVRMLRFEWLFRIFLEPHRLAIRYLFDALWLAKSCAYEWLIRLKLR